MSDRINKSLLGQSTDYIDTYTPSLLYPVPRGEARAAIGLEAPLPFRGGDLWHAYELSWLDARGKPVAAVADFSLSCDTQNIIESKSFKLYLNSFSNTRFASREEVKETLEKDLTGCAGGEVKARVLSLGEAEQMPHMALEGTCLDDIELEIDQYEYAPELLHVDTGGERSHVLYTHLLRSRCPVTGQPDWATLVVRYRGRPINEQGLLRYVVALRNHQGFHEQIIERVFMDIMARCAPAALTVYGRFTRRGGLDINPFRSNFESLPPSLRTVRQ